MKIKHLILLCFILLVGCTEPAIAGINSPIKVNGVEFIIDDVKQAPSYEVIFMKMKVYPTYPSDTFIIVKGKVIDGDVKKINSWKSTLHWAWKGERWKSKSGVVETDPNKHTFLFVFSANAKGSDWEINIPGYGKIPLKQFLPFDR